MKCPMAISVVPDIMSFAEDAEVPETNKSKLVYASDAYSAHIVYMDTV
jgi:hypothetical protein